MIRFGNVELTNPIVIGSGPLTDRFEKIASAEKAGAAAVSLKLTFVKVPFPSQMRSHSLPDQVILSPTNRRLNLQQGEALMRRVKGELNIIAMANYSAPGSAEDSWKLLTERFVAAGADILEPNFCCPNLDTSQPTSATQRDHGGVAIADHPDVCGRRVEQMRNLTDRPIVPKIMPSSRSLLLQDIAAIEQAGADGIHVVGLPATGLPPLREDGTPDIPFLAGVAPGSTNGSICRYSTNLMIALAARTTRLPILASGGMGRPSDVIDAIMWGASGVAVCSAIMWHGWEVVQNLLTGIDSFLSRQGLSSLNAVRGKALPHLTTPDRLTLLDGTAVIDETRCVGCGRCSKPGHCLAIRITDQKKARVDPAECIGCGVCRALCPVEAIRYELTTHSPQTAEHKSQDGE